jgi:hypothetical protein
MKLVTYPRSVTETDGTIYSLARGFDGQDGRGRKMLVLSGDLTGFEGEQLGEVLVCPCTAANAAALRDRLPWLRPQPLGLQKSAGCGDRLGLATPGHIRAVRAAGLPPATGTLAPILAQQSMRENARTGRTPQQVLDDAMWGAFQEGWCEPWGADADHLKTPADVDLCVAAGYSFYTIDPGDHVENEAHCASQDELTDKVLDLPWSVLDDSPERLYARYLGRHLEVSVDETETPTSPLEHFYVANELGRLGVRWVSLAPRYVGSFEKGADYIGDLDEFDDELAKHAIIARAMGPYKLSIHSGSDKFSVYPIFARRAGSLVHLKTAGTSYLEALRAMAGVEPSLFRGVLAWARERYNDDRATYHVSAEVARVPCPEDLADGELAAVLDTFDGREVLHVTFGSVLDRFGPQLRVALDAHEEAHYAALESHFRRHFSPFMH